MWKLVWLAYLHRSVAARKIQAKSSWSVIRSSARPRCAATDIDRLPPETGNRGNGTLPSGQRIAAEYCSVNRIAKLKQKKFKGYIEIYTTALRSIHTSELCNPSWGESTCRSTKTYFLQQGIPRMDAMGSSICTADMKEIYDELVGRAASNRRGNRSVATEKHSVAGYLGRVDQKLEALYFRCPYLPKVKFGIAQVAAVTPEQAESLPDDVRAKVAALLPMLLENGYAMGVAVMLLMGLRSAEACAPQIKEMIQAERSESERLAVLKEVRCTRRACGSIYPGSTKSPDKSLRSLCFEMTGAIFACG